jgi:hypothetical protein
MGREGAVDMVRLGIRHRQYEKSPGALRARGSAPPSPRMKTRLTPYFQVYSVDLTTYLCQQCIEAARTVCESLSAAAPNVCAIVLMGTKTLKTIVTHEHMDLFYVDSQECAGRLIY